MKDIEFYKMSGAGNDFIIIDNRNQVVDETDLVGFIAKVCRRKFSVGADGLILVESSDKVDFKWRFYNSDGSRAEMCGNGARCAARFAYVNRIAGPELSFETDAGIVSARMQNDRVKIRMTDPTGLRLNYPLMIDSRMLRISSINTGVPHVVVEVEDLENADVCKDGRCIRFHEAYAPAGTNANFVSMTAKGEIVIRTYERGVEDETLACGTGSVAAALIMAKIRELSSPVDVLTRSRERLSIYFRMDGDRFHDVYLEGGARIIYVGRLHQEAWA